MYPVSCVSERCSNVIVSGFQGKARNLPLFLLESHKRQILLSRRIFRDKGLNPPLQALARTFA